MSISVVIERGGWAILAVSVWLTVGSGCAGQAGKPSARDPVAPSGDVVPGGAATTPSSGPSTTPAVRQFVEPKSGTRLDYPATWSRRPSADFALLIAPDGVDPADAALSVDVPDLPPHVPGWIPIGLVRNGYVDDVRQAHPKATAADLPPPSVPGAKVRLVRAEWEDERGVVAQTALILVHGDHVVILRGTARPPHAGAARETFDAAVRSLGWGG